ncbi:MAG TPA: pyridoxal-phosphate dependent enzyme [Streptosporangiaceae bacterium]
MDPKTIHEVLTTKAAILMAASEHTPLIGPADVKAAAIRTAGRIRPVLLADADPDTEGTASTEGTSGPERTAGKEGTAGGARLQLALEYMQHSGSFKARGAANLAAAHLQDGTMPAEGIVIASGGNAALACAWAARSTQTKATVFLPETAPPFKVAKLRGYGADVRLAGQEYAEALDASVRYAANVGALLSHAYDNPLIAAGAGTLATEIIEAAPSVDTIMVAVGGGGLFSGTAAAVQGTGIRLVAVEPEQCRALNAALEAAGPVDVPVDSIAADSLGSTALLPDGL